MIGLGDLRIHEQWLPGLLCSAVRVTCKDGQLDSTISGRKQLIMFLSLDMQISIVDAIRSMLDGMSEDQIEKIIDEQLNIELCMWRCNETAYIITLRPAYSHEVPVNDMLQLSTIVDRNVLDIVCTNMEYIVTQRVKEAKITTL